MDLTLDYFEKLIAETEDPNQLVEIDTELAGMLFSDKKRKRLLRDRADRKASKIAAERNLVPCGNFRTPPRPE